MPEGGYGVLLRRVHDLFDRGTVSGMDEGRLLERFVSRRDDAAFEALVARFGPMVLGVCRRRLVNPHDVEDAFQATFLVLVRKAATIRDGDRLGNWLYGVAYRVSVRARARSRRSREVTGAEEAATATEQPIEGERRELAAVLDEELNRLPEKYRAPLLLCYLQGQTYEETARRLKWPVGTVRSRTARGRELLRSRLTRRGVTLPGGLLAATLASSAEAAVPGALSGSTVAVAARVAAGKGMTSGVVSASVADLTKGVLRAMILNKLRWAAVTVALTATLAGGAWVVAVAQPGDGPPAGANARPGAPPAAAPDDHAQVIALERRIGDLERELNALKLRLDGPQAGAPPTTQRPGASTARPIENLRKIRPRFECLVEKIHVKAGQAVKKGDPLIDVFSTELATSKNAYLTARSVALNYDKIYDLRKKLVQTGSISQQLWVDTQIDQEKNRNELSGARDRLSLYGLSQPEIDSLKDETGEEKARFTLRSPIDGTVIAIDVDPQDLTDPKTVLMVLGTVKP